MDDLVATMIREATSCDFFEAVSLLEEYFRHCANDSRPIESGRVRFGASPATAFPAADIAECRTERDGVRLILSFMGLIGSSSPLPHYFAEHVLQHEPDGGSLHDLLNVFNNRVYALYYQAWKRRRLIRGAVAPGDHSLTRIATFLAGADPRQGSGGARADLRAYAGLLAGNARSAAGLQTMLSDSFGGIPVAVQQFTPRWAPVPVVPRLGMDSRLGHNALVGVRVRDIGSSFVVVVGPLSRERYNAFLPGSDNVARMRDLVELYCADPLEFEIDVRLAEDEHVVLRLGDTSARLGYTAVLARTGKGRNAR